MKMIIRLVMTLLYLMSRFPITAGNLCDVAPQLLFNTTFSGFTKMLFHTDAANGNQCVLLCCQYEGCTGAVFQDSDSSCFLLQCPTEIPCSRERNAEGNTMYLFTNEFLHESGRYVREAEGTSIPNTLETTTTFSSTTSSITEIPNSEFSQVPSTKQTLDTTQSSITTEVSHSTTEQIHTNQPTTTVNPSLEITPHIDSDQASTTSTSTKQPTDNVQSSTTAHLSDTAQPSTTVQSVATAQPSTSVQSSTTVQSTNTVQSSATVQPSNTVKSSATVQPSTAEPSSNSIQPSPTEQSSNTSGIEPSNVSPQTSQVGSSTIEPSHTETPQQTATEPPTSEMQTMTNMNETTYTVKPEQESTGNTTGLNYTMSTGSPSQGTHNDTTEVNPTQGSTNGEYSANNNTASLPTNSTERQTVLTDKTGVTSNIFTTTPPLLSANESLVDAEIEASDRAMSAALIAALSFGILFFAAVVVLLSKRVYDGWQRRHYSRVDYLVNGMYN